MGVVLVIARIVDYRPGAMRISPYFYNTIDDIEAFMEALPDVL